MKERVKKLLWISIAFTLIFCLLLSGCNSPKASPGAEHDVSNNGENAGKTEEEFPLPDWPDYVSFGAAAVGGSAYIMFSGLADMMNRHLGIPATAEAFGTTVPAYEALKRGEVEFVTEAPLYLYYDDRNDIRAIAPNVLFAMYVWTTENSGINTIEDLRGKKVMCYSEVGWSGPAAQAIINSVGLTNDDLIAMPISSADDGATALRDGEVDAFIWAGSAKGSIAAYSEMELLIDAKIVPLSEKSQQYIADNPDNDPILIGWFPGEIDGGIYECAPEPVPTVVRPTNIVTRADLPESFIYELTKLIFGEDTRDEWLSIHPDCKNVTTERLGELSKTTLYHPGAVKFYKEIGAWTDEFENDQKQLKEELLIN